MYDRMGKTADGQRMAAIAAADDFAHLQLIARAPQ